MLLPVLSEFMFAFGLRAWKWCGGCLSIYGMMRPTWCWVFWYHQLHTNKRKYKNPPHTNHPKSHSHYQHSNSQQPAHKMSTPIYQVYIPNLLGLQMLQVTPYEEDFNEEETAPIIPSTTTSTSTSTSRSSSFSYIPEDAF